MTRFNGVVKLSGNSLGFSKQAVNNIELNIDPVKVKHYALSQYELCKKRGINPFTIIGGSNLANGADLLKNGIVTDKRIGDLLGIEATHVNVREVYNVLKELDVPVICLSTLAYKDDVFEPYNLGRLIELSREKEIICLIAGGSGHSGCTTDTAAAFYSHNIGLPKIIKATASGGVFDKDPRMNLDAKIYDYITYREVLLQDLKVMDRTAIAYCWDNDLDVYVTGSEDADTMERIIKYDENPGSLITSQEKILKLTNR